MNLQLYLDTVALPLNVLLQLQELRKLISSYDKQVNSMKTEINQKVLFH